jgi:hypothetical protein
MILGITALEDTDRATETEISGNGLRSDWNAIAISTRSFHQQATLPALKVTENRHFARTSYCSKM